MSLARFSVVIAYDVAGGIGYSGKVPWHYPEDMKFFKGITEGNNVIMGRKTFDSLPPKYSPLPNRRNIVVSRSLKQIPLGIELVGSISSALSLCYPGCERTTFIIGGAHIFNEAVNTYFHLCDGIFATEITKKFNCDTVLDLSFRNQCTRYLLENNSDYRRFLYKPNQSNQ